MRSIEVALTTTSIVNIYMASWHLCVKENHETELSNGLVD